MIVFMDLCVIGMVSCDYFEANMFAFYDFQTEVFSVFAFLKMYCLL